MNAFLRDLQQVTILQKELRNCCSLNISNIGYKE